MAACIDPPHVRTNEPFSLSDAMEVEQFLDNVTNELARERQKHEDGKKNAHGRDGREGGRDSRDTRDTVRRVLGHVIEDRKGMVE